MESREPVLGPLPGLSQQWRVHMCLEILKWRPGLGVQPNGVRGPSLGLVNVESSGFISSENLPFPHRIRARQIK